MIHSSHKILAPIVHYDIYSQIESVRRSEVEQTQASPYRGQDELSTILGE